MTIIKLLQCMANSGSMYFDVEEKTGEKARKILKENPENIHSGFLKPKN